MIAPVNSIASFVCRLLLMLVSSGLPCAMADEIYVIANADAKLTAGTIRDIYIGEKQFSGSIRIIPIDNAAAQTAFLGKVLKLELSRYENLWVKKSFRDALNPPAMKYSDKEVIELVRKTPGAIGYIAASPPAGITVIQKF